MASPLQELVVKRGGSNVILLRRRKDKSTEGEKWKVSNLQKQMALKHQAPRVIVKRIYSFLSIAPRKDRRPSIKLDRSAKQLALNHGSKFMSRSFCDF